MTARNAIVRARTTVTLLPQRGNYIAPFYRALIIKFLKKYQSARKTAVYRNSMPISRSNYDNRRIPIDIKRFLLVLLRKCYKSEHSDISDRGSSIYQLGGN
jgi:hypothetical protein